MSRRRWAVLVSVVLGIVFGSVATLHAESPPAAKRVEYRHSWHGEAIADEYYWLREKSNPEVTGYLDAENAYTEAMTKDLRSFQETVYQEMLSRIKQTDLSVPTRRGEYYYYSRTDEGRQYSIQCRRKGCMDAPEEVLLDANELAKGHAFFSVRDSSVSDDGKLLAYATDTTGFRQNVLHVKDLASGEELADTAQRVTSIEWAADNKTLFFTTEDPITKRSNQFWRQTLGEPNAELIYEEKDELFRVHAGRTRDKKFVLMQVTCGDTSETRYIPSDQPTAEFRVLVAREKGHRYRLDHRDGLFYICTNKDAKNFRIVTAPDGDPGPHNWQVFVEHRDDVLVERVEAFKNFAVVMEKSNALNGIRIFDFRSGTWQNMTFPEPVYAAYSSFNSEFDEPILRYSYQSLVTPPSVMGYDVGQQRSTLIKQQEVLGGYDPAQYVSERLWATARDGTKVPLSIVYKRGFRRDGSQPLLLYAYGSYGAGTSASFSSDRVSLLDRGMAFAIAHVRGGNEMGEAWRDGGMLMKKKNTFNDFVDCAEYLIQEKWSSPDRLVIEGASAGGLLMGVVVNMRPDLFRAVHAGVPFVDVINTMMDASLPLTVGEYLVWGNPQEKEAYDYMKSYSPYDNLEKRAYPAMLVTAGLNDSQVMYWEPAKYVARMRTVKTDSNPLLLKTNMCAGHSGSSGRYARLKEQAFAYAWLMSQVGIVK